MISTLKRADQKSLKEIDEEKRIRKTDELFILFSLGSQFDHLIKQHLDKLGVFCLVADPASVTVKDIQKIKPIGILLSGGPVSIYETPPPFDAHIFDLGIPVLGICLGFQLWANYIGAKILPASKREFGVYPLKFNSTSKLFKGCKANMPVLESHGDIILKSGKLKNILAHTDHAPVSAANYKHLWGVQFHPEVTDSLQGEIIFKNFCFGICRAKSVYPAEKVAEKKIADLRNKIGREKVLLALSCGSDSSIVAYLLKEALRGKKGQFHAVYIKGIDRPDDEAYAKKFFAEREWINFEIFDATQLFLKALQGKATMPEKRKAMRGIYKNVLEAVAKKKKASNILQGTLYTDNSESGFGYDLDANVKKAQIKLHHNVNLKFKLKEITPLDDCVKDTGRNIGRIIGVPEELLIRHPFPGPGIIVRIEGEVTKENLIIARKADGIFIEELRQWKLYDGIWQAGAVVTKSVTTCTKGDDGVSGKVIALWAVWSINGFTARWAELPNDFLRLVSQKITSEIKEVGRVVYNISDKPPATIEWG